jgi:hypothetical protein
MIFEDAHWTDLNRRREEFPHVEIPEWEIVFGRVVSQFAHKRNAAKNI